MAIGRDESKWWNGSPCANWCMIRSEPETLMKEKVSFWRSFGVSLLCWTAIGIILGWGLFADDRDHANYLPYAHYFVWEAAEAYSWALLTPFLFVFARRYPFDREHWLQLDREHWLQLDREHWLQRLLQ